MINTSESRIIFNGNGTATEFPYSFAIINDTDVKVMTVDPDGVETVLDSDYYVDVTASKVIYPGYPPGEEPAESERPPVLPTGWQLVVYRDIPITQEADLGDRWPFNVIESALDKISMILQNIYDSFKRSLKVGQNAPANIDIVVPIEANKALKWNADGTQIVLTVDPADVLPQAQTLLQQTTEQANIATNKANAAAESALAAATSESNAGAHEDKAQAWAESETSPDGEPTSKSAKTWAGDSADSAELAQKWAESETSPDGEDDADSPTGDTMSAKEWALYAKEIAENMGNPVTDVDEENGTVTVTKSDGTQSSFKAGINILQRNKTYAVEDIAYSFGLPSWSYLECTEAGTTAAAEPSYTEITTPGQYVTDGTAEFILCDIRDGTPVGDVVYRPFLMDGYVKANGATVNRSDYPTLVQYANDHSLWTNSPASEPWKYGNGNGSTTMTLPDYRNRVIQGGDSTAIVAAGLPNITGVAYQAENYGFFRVNENGKASGAFKKGKSVQGLEGGGYDGQPTTYLGFDASGSNAIYGASNTVQPPALRLIAQIKF